MPRMLANEFVYGAEERYNEYITPASPPLQHYHQQAQPIQHHHHQPAATLTASTSMEDHRHLKSRSPRSSPPQEFTHSSDGGGQNTSPEMPQQQHIHIVCSSDAGEDANPVVIDKPMAKQSVASISSDDMEDFEGFEEDTTPETSALLQAQYQNDDTYIRDHLKRHSPGDYHDYREDSEGVVEAIEVDDDEDIEEVDGQCLFRSRREKTPVKIINRYAGECNPHTPNKRKKRQNDGIFEAVTPPHLKTPPDQIVEINSDSTTISQKQKRQQINTKFQLNLNQKQNHKANNATANKCSTESTSEFPVSSPSNPQQPRGGGGKYPPRPPLLKNTLPADSFERQLAMITACNPQMTLSEKIQSWCFEDELSDVEDVTLFDEEFKRLEEQKKSELTKQKNKKSTGGIGNDKQYDFAIFRQMIIHNMNLAQQSKRFTTGGPGGCGPGGFSSASAGAKGHEETSGSSSESSKSVKHLDERPSTSAVAQQQLQQRRCKPPNTNLETGEMKKQRFVKEISNSKRNQNSTSPPATSSSENDRDCFQNSKKVSGTHKRFPSGGGGGGGGGGGQILIHEKLQFPSSSEEANSQDVPTHMHLTQNANAAAAAAITVTNNFRYKTPIKSSKPENAKDSKNVNCLAANEEVDSVFRLHRLNREIDKYSSASIGDHENLKAAGDEREEETIMAGVLIQMRMGGSDDGGVAKEAYEKSPTETLKKNKDLFKTPTVPPKYFLCHSTGESPIPICSSPPTKNFSTSPPAIGEQKATTLAVEPPQIDAAAAVAASYDPTTSVTSDIKLENGTADDEAFDGVYHQQHEFCNYLGLTGMSTATAMANAISELAQCNPARRSMRVLRQQQQERKEKSAKEERELRALKDKQFLKESRKRELRVEADENINLQDEGTNSQTSEPTHSTPSLKEMKKKTSIASLTTKSSSESQPSSVTIVKTEPQIKILCHIEASPSSHHKNEEAENIVPKEISQPIPIRETLMRQAKQKKAPQDTAADKKQTEDEEEEHQKIKTDIKTEDFHKEDFKWEADGQLSPSEPFVLQDKRRKLLRSPRLINKKTNLKIAQNKTINLEDKEPSVLKEHNVNTAAKREEELQTSPNCKREDVTGELPTTTSMASPQKSELKSSLSVSHENMTKTKDELEYPSCDEVLSIDRALTPTSALIKQKLQAALEESRKTKPSIFIVQSLESNKDKLVATKSVSALEIKSTPPTTPEIEVAAAADGSSKVEIKKQLSTKLSEITSKIAKAVGKKKNSKNLLKVRKAKTLTLRSTPKRELRARKIILLKSNKKERQLNKKMAKEIKQPVTPTKKCSNTKTSNSSLKSKELLNKVERETTLNNVKSYRHAQTETNDLEIYNKQSRTRLMAKASALLQRSRRRMSLSRPGGGAGGAGKDLRSRLIHKNTAINLRANVNTELLQPKVCLMRAKIAESPKEECKTSSTSTRTAVATPDLPTLATTTNQNGSALQEDREASNLNIKSHTSSVCLMLENDNVVVSSTTNSYDERPPHHGNPPLITSSPITLRSVHSSASCVVASTPVETKDNWTQSEESQCGRICGSGAAGVRYLNGTPSATQTMRNPLKKDFGLVQYIYYEVDILIAVQERLISFWKSSRLLNALTASNKINNLQQTKPNTSITAATTSMHNNNSSPLFGLQLPMASSSTSSSRQTNGEWVILGELKRLTYDVEVFSPYANRICLHNSTPIYVEMRARPLPNNHRECNLLSMYINIYYYHDEDMIAKTNSIQLDTIQSDIECVNYTTLVDSRYFIMTWPQENLLGKTRSGLCKYSLTPQLDTLASIREFKSMRHTIRYLECLSDDKLIGFGDSQVTIWDHRSGDVLMNYDLDIPLGKHLGSVHYPSQEMIDQSNMILLFQYRDLNPDKPEPPELLTIACTIAHTQPTYRILQHQQLPVAFKVIKRAINTGEHLVITNANDEEIWICCNNPALVALVPQQMQAPLQSHKQRFFSRERSQLIELTEQTLNFDTLANHVLQLAAGLAVNNK